MASKTNPITFLQQVRAETAKVSWPTRRETVISTIMVVVMAFLLLHSFSCRSAYGLWRRIYTWPWPLSRIGELRDDSALVHRSRLFQLRKEGG
ncbi:preprotein translocase subunit SecE [Brucella pseudogrignonensis]|nr:preprotein translocase subunit SecE [Brucella pseudogrignonensis]